MQEMLLWSLGWEDPLEKEMATHSSILKDCMDRGARQATVHGIAKSWAQLSEWAHTQKHTSYTENIFTT